MENRNQQNKQGQNQQNQQQNNKQQNQQENKYKLGIPVFMKEDLVPIIGD